MAQHKLTLPADPDRPYPTRQLTKLKLREAGYSVRQINAFIRHGWAGVVGVTQAENDELREVLAKLTETVSVVTNPGER